MGFVPPPIRTPIQSPSGGIHPIWQRWFIDLYKRSGGVEATPLDDLELALTTSRDTVPDAEIAQDYPTRPIAQPAESLDWLMASNRASDEPMHDYPLQHPEAHSGWNDVLTDLSSGRGIGANAPAWSTLRDGIKAYAFDATAMNEVWVNMHIMHDYAWGTKVWPHIHWTTSGTGTGVVRWGVEYTYARGYGVEAFPATTTIYLEQAATGIPYTQMIAEPAEADGILLPGCEPDGVLMCRVFRDAGHANDTLTDDAFGIFADLHFQSDGYLTNERNRGYTKRRA